MYEPFDRSNLRRNRVAQMAAEIEEAEDTLTDPAAPDHVKHFYASQLPVWKERYAEAVKRLQAGGEQSLPEYTFSN